MDDAYEPNEGSEAAEETGFQEGYAAGVNAARWIIVSGTPTDGLSFYGPLECSDDAERIVSHWCDTDWWLTQIEPVPDDWKRTD